VYNRTPHEGGLINIEEGQLGRNFESIFAAYIVDSQEIWIRDPNLCHTHQVRTRTHCTHRTRTHCGLNGVSFGQQVYNLIRFCELVVRINRKVTRPCLRIHVVTAFENDMQLDTLQSALNELTDSLKVRCHTRARTLPPFNTRMAV
jgi:hypothetical protein